jgi:hypothetical protein
MLPLVVTVKKTTLRFTCIIIIVICVVYSFKRAALIGMLLSLLAYYLIDITENRKKIVNNISGFAFITLFFLYIFNKTDKLSSGYLISRLLNAKDDQGSDRVILWTNMINEQLNTDILDWIFGQGFLASTNITYGLGAHNDFLEILYDFGILSLTSFILFNFILIRYCFKMYQSKYIYRKPFIVSYILFINMSLFSQLVIFPTYIYYLALFWGISIGMFERYLVMCSNNSMYYSSSISLFDT